MNDQESTAEQPAADWRVKLGVAVFALSIIFPVAGIPAVASLDLSGTITASLSGALLIVAEVLGVVAVAIMGKPGYLFVKSRVFGFVQQYGPPKQVSRRRYNIGLVLFCVPILFGWLSIYLFDLIPGFADYPLPYAVCGDLVLLASLFVLGGDFWAKIRALFVYSDKVCSPAMQQNK